MAYASVISLKHTIEGLSKSSRIFLVPLSQEIIEFACKELQTLQENLKSSDSGSGSISSSETVNALDAQIRETVCKFEDVLEYHVSRQIASQSESIGHGTQFSVDLQHLKQDIDSFILTVKKMEEEYIHELRNPIPEEEDKEKAALSSKLDFAGKRSKMVGLLDEYKKLKDILVADSEKSTTVEVIPLVGMAGIGKTTLANKIFEDPSIISHFDCCARVKVGLKCNLKEILRCILAQANPNSDKMLVEGDENIGQYLYKNLQGKRYLIVLDDIWDQGRWKEIQYLFPDDKNGSRVLLTSRLQHVAEEVNHRSPTIKMRLLNKEESWYLLRQEVFADEFCPHQFEKPGKNISENCEGLPLTIVTVADLLLKAEKTPEYWKEIAAKKDHQLFTNAYDEISRVLYPSYEYLTQQLKVCFLYMGVFPQNYEIHKSKLINMWAAEGFLEKYRWERSKIYIEQCLYELIFNNVVVLRRESSIRYLITTAGVKTCGVHSSMWHLCNREARKNNFFHSLSNYDDGLADDIKQQRRLCVHNNILFGIKEVRNSMECNGASTARSLLCFGPYHLYSVPICFGLRLLRVLDALTIRFYEFPMQIVKLVQLRYLAITCNEKLPASISKLWNLQFLIVRRHLTIKSYEAQSYLPVEIWDMKELKHLQVMQSDLPNSFGTPLENLLTLVDVSGCSCTQGVLKRVPNLKNLGIRIELAPDDAKLLSFFDHISILSKLETFKCVIVNPNFGSGFVQQLVPSMFPWGLKKLSLSGLGFPWEYLREIASLRHLKVLKLRCYAFRGPKWQIEKNAFPRLNFLLIEDTDLVQWIVEHGSFPRLTHLCIRYCYKLEELHWIYDYPGKIEVIDCNPVAVKQVKEAESRKQYDFLGDSVHSSWDDGKFRS